jgi:hypothetical protein
MYTIRPYERKDATMLQSWYKDQGQNVPHEDFFCETGTFLLQLNGEDAIAQGIYVTQSMELCYLEGLIKNPAIKVNLEEALVYLLDFLSTWAKDAGYKNLITYCAVEKLKPKYERIGLTRSMDNLSVFYKRL